MLTIIKHSYEIERYKKNTLEETGTYCREAIQYRQILTNKKKKKTHTSENTHYYTGKDETNKWNFENISQI